MMDPDELGNEVIDADDIGIRLPRVRRPVTNCVGPLPVLQNGYDSGSNIRLDFLPMKSDRGRGRPARLPRPSDYIFVMHDTVKPFPVSPPKLAIPARPTSFDGRLMRKGRGISFGNKSMSSTGSAGSSIKSDPGLINIDRFDIKEPLDKDRFIDAEDDLSVLSEPMMSPGTVELMPNIQTASKPSEEDVVAVSIPSKPIEGSPIAGGATPTKTNLIERVPATVERAQIKSLMDFSYNFRLVSEATDQRAAKKMFSKPEPIKDSQRINIDSSNKEDPSLFLGFTTNAVDSPKFVVVKSPCRISSRANVGSRPVKSMEEFSRKVPSPCSNVVTETSDRNVFVPDKNFSSPSTDWSFPRRPSLTRTAKNVNKQEPISLTDFRVETLKSAIDGHKSDDTLNSHQTKTSKDVSPNVPSLFKDLVDEAANSIKIDVSKSRPPPQRHDFGLKRDVSFSVPYVPTLTNAVQATNENRPPSKGDSVTGASNSLPGDFVPSKPNFEVTSCSKPFELKPAKAILKPVQSESSNEMKLEMPEPPLMTFDSDNVSSRAPTTTKTTMSAQASKSPLKIMSKLTLRNMAATTTSAASLPSVTEESKPSHVAPRTWGNAQVQKPNFESKKSKTTESARKNLESVIQSKPSEEGFFGANSSELNQKMANLEIGNKRKFGKSERPVTTLNSDTKSSRVPTLTTTSAEASMSSSKRTTTKLTLKNVTTTKATEENKSSRIDLKTWGNAPLLTSPTFELSVPSKPNLGSIKSPKKDPTFKQLDSVSQTTKPFEKGLNGANGSERNQKMVHSETGSKSKFELPKPPVMTLNSDTKSSRVPTTTMISKSSLKLMTAKLTLRNMTTSSASSALAPEECKSSHVVPKSWEEAQLLNPPKFDRYGLPIRPPVQPFCMAHDFPSLLAGKPPLDTGTTPTSTVAALSSQAVPVVKKAKKKRSGKKKANTDNHQPDILGGRVKEDVQVGPPLMQTETGTIVIENLPTVTCKGFLQDFLQEFDRIVDIQLSRTAASTTAEVTIADGEKCDWIVSLLDKSSIVPGENSGLLSVWRKE